MALKFPDRLESNNPDAYGIIRGDQIAGSTVIRMSSNISKNILCSDINDPSTMYGKEVNVDGDIFRICDYNYNDEIRYFKYHLSSNGIYLDKDGAIYLSTSNNYIDSDGIKLGSNMSIRINDTSFNEYYINLGTKLTISTNYINISSTIIAQDGISGAYNYDIDEFTLDLGSSTIKLFKNPECVRVNNWFSIYSYEDENNSESNYISQRQFNLYLHDSDYKYGTFNINFGILEDEQNESKLRITLNKKFIISEDGFNHLNYNDNAIFGNKFKEILPISSAEIENLFN